MNPAKTEIEQIPDFKDELTFKLNAKGFIQVDLKARFLNKITKSDIDNYADLYSYSVKAIEKKGYNLQPEEIKK
jgi:hypothetical protein